MAFCTNCGANVGDARFCTNCGTKVEQQPTAQPAEAMETPISERMPAQPSAQSTQDIPYGNGTPVPDAASSADDAAQTASFSDPQASAAQNAPFAGAPIPAAQATYGQTTEFPPAAGVPEGKKPTNKKKALLLVAGGIVLAAAIVAVLFLFVFGKDSKTDRTEGYYVLTYMKADGIELDQDSLQSFGITGHLILEKGGSGTLALMMNGGEQNVMQISWTDKTITVDGERIRYTRKDGVLTIEEEGQLMKFERSSEAPPAFEATEPASGTVDPSLVGKYVLTEYLVQGEAQEPDESWYELFADGTGRSYDVGEWEFTWFVLNDKVYMRDDGGNETVAELQNGALVITNSFFDTVSTYTPEGALPTTPDVAHAGFYVAEQMQNESGVATKENLEALGIHYTLLLEEDGTGVMSYSESMNFAITWTESEISYGGEVMQIAFEDDCVTVNLDESTSILYRKSTDAAATDAADYWNNSWYGYLVVTYGSGEFDGWGDGSHWWDCCAKTGIQDDGLVHMILWDEDGSASEPFSEAQFTIDQDGTSAPAGRLISENGYFYETIVLPEDWIVDPADAGLENMVYIHGSYTDPNNAENCFGFSIVLRPWGTLWDDWYAEDETCLPEHYESWYLPLLEQEVTAAPDHIG